MQKKKWIKVQKKRISSAGDGAKLKVYGQNSHQVGVVVEPVVAAD